MLSTVYTVTVLGVAGAPVQASQQVQIVSGQNGPSDIRWYRPIGYAVLMLRIGTCSWKYPS